MSGLETKKQGRGPSIPHQPEYFQEILFDGRILLVYGLTHSILHLMDVIRLSLTQCSLCNSSKIWKDGIRQTRKGDVQRYICRNCGSRFSESRGLNISRVDSWPRQICVNEEKMKNLAKMESRIEKWPAGGTETDIATVKGKILELSWKLKRDGYSEATIKGYSRFLHTLVKLGANLYDPENVKEVIARKETWNESTKFIVAASYSAFARANEIRWQKPKYKVRQKIPFIPLEQEIDTLIAGCGKKTATVLRLLKETGMRIGEALKVQWIDVDLEKNLIAVNSPEKGSNARIFKISNELASMLNALPKENDIVFGGTRRGTISRTFYSQRKRIARKLQNPRLQRITFHTFRHWYGTMQYSKTQNILYVMQKLGHKNIKNTLIYTHLVDFESDEFHSTVAKTAEEARKLIEAGFEYVCTTPEDLMLFRKRK